MLNIKLQGSKHLIPISYFDKCLSDNVPKQDIIKAYPKRIHGAYYLDKFSNYIKDKYNISLREYCEKFLTEKWPTCPTSGEKVGFILNGKGLVFSKFKQGKVSKEFCPKFAAACEAFSEERQGSNNPMFGKTPWNKGLGIEDERVARIAAKRSGVKTSEEVKAKQSESAKKRTIHGHTGHKHSPETKRKMREIIAKRYRDGLYNRKSSIQIKMGDFLKSLSLVDKIEEEFFIKYFSLDFALPNLKIAIECQGTFFHVDPRIYPNGPICAIQRRNFGRDKAKKKALEKIGWKIIEAWETEINDETFKEQVTCELKKLKALKVSE